MESYSLLVGFGSGEKIRRLSKELNKDFAVIII